MQLDFTGIDSLPGFLPNRFAEPPEAIGAGRCRERAGRWLRRAALVLAVGVAVFPAHGRGPADVLLGGVFGSKAVLVIDGGLPQTLAVGQLSAEGVRLLAAGESTAVVEHEGAVIHLRLGEFGVRAARHEGGGRSFSVQADAQGHFFAPGKVNGVDVEMLVDTGATLVSMGRAHADRLGLNYSAARRVAAASASGTVGGWVVRLERVEVAALRLQDVEALVLDSELPYVLLGMSFLNRVQWQRDGRTLRFARQDD